MIRAVFNSESSSTVVARKVMKDTNFSMHILQSIFRISLLFGKYHDLLFIMLLYK